MTQVPGGQDGFPAAFDGNFDIGRLVEPSPDTREEFNKAFASLEQFATERSSTSIEVFIGEPESTDLYVSFYCSQGWYTIAPQGSKTKTSSLNMSGCRGNERYLMNAGYQSNDRTKDGLGGLFEELVSGTVEEDAKWLRKVWAEVQKTDQDAVPKSVESLLGSSPYPLGEHSLYYMNGDFQDGTSIQCDWVTGNDAFISEFPADMTLRTIFLTAPDGREFEYNLWGDGREEIFQKINGEMVAHEVTVPAEITAETDQGLSLSVRGDAAFMRGMQQVAAARAEARRSGSTNPTEGSLSDMKDIINGAVASGLKPKPESSAASAQAESE